MICHQYNCIFVHIPKVAGQSIERVFLNLLDLNWQTRAPLLLRENNNPEIGPPRLAHLTAKEYVKYHYLSQKLFDTYFKFAFVRNPWSRVVSFYYYLGYNKKCNFQDFVVSYLPFLFNTYYWFVRPQVDFLLDNGKIILDFIGKFENLQQDFLCVCEKLEIIFTKLEHTNKSCEKKYKKYQSYYDNISKDKVYKYYNEDIKFFSYEF